MRCRGPCLGSCHRHDLFFLSRLHIGEEIIGIVIAEADNRIGDANRSFVRSSDTTPLTIPMRQKRSFLSFMDLAPESFERVVPQSLGRTSMRFVTFLAT